MRVAVPAEVHPGERRVAAAPDTVERFVKLGFEVVVESGAGQAADFTDEQYAAAGAELTDEVASLWADADVIVKVQPPADHPALGRSEVELLHAGQTLITPLSPAQNADLLAALAEKGVTVLGLDCVPRISRAQSMDILSSMGGIAGYRAVIEAAAAFGRFLGPQMSAAGSTPPARVMVIGAGVAGLAAIATARETGAQVYAFDTRAAVREEVESLGGKFLELEFEESGEGAGGYGKVMSEAFIAAEMALFREQAPLTDIIITTAMIPGRDAPLLLPTDIVEEMRPGSVVVDLAAASGGNCELTVPDEVVTHEGVKILGYTNLPARMPAHASEYFGRNLVNLLDHLGGADGWAIDTDDTITRGMLLVHDGEVTWPPPKIEPTVAPEADEPPAEPVVVREPEAQRHGNAARGVLAALAIILFTAIGLYAPPDFVGHFTVFVLACFVGWQVVWNVSHSLHTPLMSVTNAISGIIILGGIILVTTEASAIVLGLGAAAMLVASINIFGGFLVTQRMLRMFRRGPDTGDNATGGGHA